jgi:isoleucyl-tRNA synthetase
MFKAVSTEVRFPELEQRILEFWKANRVYQRSLEQRTGGPSFVFYEGPPTANGMPHPGHCLTRAIKDLFPRYRTMRGYHCRRKAGWDTHGLPVEVEVCKELGIHGKEEIESFGVEPFIQKCQQSVWRYMQQWEQLTERLGFWIDLNDAYVTYHQSYVESVWWSLKNLFDRGLLYRGYKIVWWWAQGGTALSSGEVGQGYRQVADPSVYVRFPLLDPADKDLIDASLIVWTTTPWTLPSNQFAAIHPDLVYAVCDDGTGRKLIVAEALVTTLAEKAKLNLQVVKTIKGSEMVGWRYRPPFDFYAKTMADASGRLKQGGTQSKYWRVVAADFVTTESGTGLVHLAPAFGEVDFEVLLKEQDRFVAGEHPTLLCAVGPDGKFTSDAPPFQGTWVKDADRAVTRALRESDLLYHQEQYLHDYPFCWRADQDPLIQYPRESWFIKTTAFRDEMLSNNKQIGWMPDHIRDGRFGNFLESNVDWALSRERYWGTPLPIWVCEKTGRMEALGSYDELLAKPGLTGTEVWENAKAANPELVEDLKVHKPYIDAVTYQSPFDATSRMRRVSEVIDCWYDSGAMPFAQWGYPHQGQAEFASQFPADFISEAIDQTRGWFYSQLAISTMLFGKQANAEKPTAATSGAGQVLVQAEHAYPHPFRNCIVLGLMLAEWYESKDGKRRFLTEEEARRECGTQYVSKTGKMSKQLRNYRSPQEIFDNHGADALRWYFFANQPPWNSIIYSERAIRDSIPEFLLRLWNVLSFFTIYGEIDGFKGPADIAGDLDQLTPQELARSPLYRPVAQRDELDRWILSELTLATDEIVKCMDAYDNYGACQRLISLVDGLSNWYVRRSRDRFWAEDVHSPDKIDAYWTLYECLAVITKLIAPFVPFTAEAIWQELVRPVQGRVRESVHLCDYPQSIAEYRDEALVEQMATLREIASLGRAARMESKLKVRQPLARVEVVLADHKHLGWLQDHDAILREELNVKAIDYPERADEYVQYTVVPNFRRLGPRVGPLLPKVKSALGAARGAELLQQLQDLGHVRLQIDSQEVILDREDIEVRLQAKSGWAAAQGKQCVVVLSTELTPELIREGLAKDLNRIIGDMRKKNQCRFTDRIRLVLVGVHEEVEQMLDEQQVSIMQAALITEIVRQPVDGVALESVELGSYQVDLGIQIVG